MNIVLLLTLSLVFVTLLLIVALAFLFVQTRRQQQLAGTLDRTKQMLDLAESVGGVGVWAIGHDGHELFWSDNVFKLHGRDPRSGPPSLAAAIAYFDVGDRSQIVELINYALKNGQSYEFEARMVAEDGRHKRVFSRGICQLDKQGDVKYVFGVVIEKPRIDQSLPALSKELVRLRA